MHILRRLIAWAFYCGLLAAVGFVVFQYVRHTPRCTIKGPLQKQHLSADGSRLITLKRPKEWTFTHRFPSGPLQVWDLQSGRLLREMWGDKKLWISAFSPENQHIAALDFDRKLYLADCNSGQEWTFEFDDEGRELLFSRKGNWLSVSREKANHFVDVQHGRLVPYPEGHLLCFNPDEDAVFLNEEIGRDISVVDLGAGKKSSAAVLGSWNSVASPDGSLLAAWRGPDKPVEKSARTEQNHGIEIWDLTTLKQRSHWMVPEANVHPSSQAVFSRDGRTLAYSHVDKSGFVVRFFDSAQGKELGSSKILAEGAEHIEIRDVPPNGSLWACVYLVKNKGHMVTLDSATGRVLWNRPYPADYKLRVAKQTVFWHDENDELSRFQILDARSGNCQATAQRRNSLIGQLTPDAQRFFVIAPNEFRVPFFWETWLNERWPEQFGDTIDTTIVMESTTGRELFVATGQAVPWDSNCLSDDGSTLLTKEELDPNDHTIIIKVWDVNPHRAWTWSLSAVAATILLYLAAARSLRALRKRKRARADC